jgi:tRNA (guanosine-2'-O-)-methyltransferase
VESFNVSVSVALCLYDIMQRLRTSGYKWQLSEEEKQDIMLEWIRQVSKTAAMIAKEAIKK